MTTTNLTPRWTCYFKRPGETFQADFLDLDAMLIAISRAKVLGFRCSVGPFKRRGGK